MKNQYTFSIDKPCAESWEAMSVSDKGKFCMSCQHEVIDFSLMSDQEIIRLIGNVKGSVCGRFENKQLLRPMVLSENLRRPVSIAAIMAGIVMLSVVAPSLSEAGPRPHVVQTSVNSNKETLSKEVISMDSVIVYRGKVLSLTGKNGVGGISVFLADSSQMVVTDSVGYFELPIPTELARTTYEIKLVDNTFVFESNTITVDGLTKDYNLVQTIYLLPHQMHTMGKVMMVPLDDQKPKKKK